jgi:hypothetical protein
MFLNFEYKMDFVVDISQKKRTNMNLAEFRQSDFQHQNAACDPTWYINNVSSLHPMNVRS